MNKAYCAIGCALFVSIVFSENVDAEYRPPLFGFVKIDPVIPPTMSPMMMEMYREAAIVSAKRIAELKGNAYMYYYSGNYVEAIRNAKSAEEINDKYGRKDYELYKVLGLSFKEIKWYKSSKKYLKKALKEVEYDSDLRIKLDELNKDYKLNRDQYVNK